MATTIFSEIQSGVDEILKIFTDATLNEKFTWIQGSLAAILTVVIMYKGFQTLAGRTQSPIKELVWDISKKLLIMMFVLNINGWFTQSKELCDAFYNWASGGENFYGKLDTITDKYISAMSSFSASMTTGGLWGDAVLLGPLWCMICLTIGFIFITLAFAFTLITAQLTNTLLIFVLPIALFALMWERTKQMFGQWLNMFISNLIVLILYSSLANLVIRVFETTFTLGVTGIDKTFPFFSKGISILLTSIMLVVAIKMVVQIAQGLASVSLDSGAGAAAAGVMGSAGAAVGMAGKAGKAVGGMAGRSVMGGVAGAVDAGGGIGSRLKGFAAGANGVNAAKRFLKTGSFQKTSGFGAKTDK